MAPLSRVALAAAALAVLSAADSAEGARPRPSFHTGTQQRTPSSERASGRQSIALHDLGEGALRAPARIPRRETCPAILG